MQTPLLIAKAGSLMITAIFINAAKTFTVKPATL